MKKISFKSMQLIINGNVPEKKDMINISNSNRIKYIDENKKQLYKFKVNYNEDEEYLWIYAEYDYLNKRNNIIYNDISDEEEPNPRKPYQIELKNQFFGMYYLKNNTLYLSDRKKMKILIDYLKSILNVDVNIKLHYKDIDEFSKAICSLKNIKFTVRPDLFQEETGIYNYLNNIYGFDLAEYIKIDVNYGRLSFKKNIDKFIKRIFQNYDNNQFNKLVVCGYDDNDIENIFNTEKYVVVVDIYVNTEKDTDLFNSDDVKKKILSNLKKIKRGK